MTWFRLPVLVARRFSSGLRILTVRPDACQNANPPKRTLRKRSKMGRVPPIRKLNRLCFIESLYRPLYLYQTRNRREVRLREKDISAMLVGFGMKVVG